MFSWLAGFFGNPLMAAGALTGAIPIVIHLLNRQKYRRVVWAAMHWLWAAQKKNRRRLLIEQLLLLLIRVLILVLLAFALARPALQEGAGLLAGRPSVHRVILIDNSYSMGLLVNGKPLFDKARERAIAVIESMNASDDLDVYFMNSSLEELPRGNQNRQQSIGDIKAAKLSDLGTNIPRGIAGACKQILERHSKNARKEIVIITDTTRSAWLNSTGPRHLESSEEKSITDAFADPRTRPHLYVARLAGAATRENLAAAALEVEERVVPAGVETQLVASVKNCGLNARRNVGVELLVDGERAGREEIANIEPGKTESVYFRHTFTGTGSHALSAQLARSTEDNLPADDSSFLALDVEEQVKVLCVDGQQSPTPNGSELDFFKQALAPTRASEVNAGKMPLLPETISDSAFPDANLDEYRLAVLGNVSIVPPEKLTVLEQYVRRGGSLWIWLGEKTDPSLYNKEWAALLPAVIGDTVGEGKEDGAFEALSDKETSHPAVKKLAEIKGMTMGELHTFRRFKLTPKPPKDGQVPRTVLACENGDPLAVEWALGEGHVLLIGTTADRTWNDWPKRKHFMPLINFLALDMIQPAHAQRNRLAGESFAYTLKKDELGAARREGIQLKDPYGELIQLDVQPETFRAVSKPARRAGIYAGEVPGDRRRAIHFASNRVLEESDLDPIEDKELKAFFPVAAGAKPAGGSFFQAAPLQDDLDLTGGDPGQLEDAIKKHSSGREIWRALAIMVLALMVAESVLAWMFGRPDR